MILAVSKHEARPSHHRVRADEIERRGLSRIARGITHGQTLFVQCFRALSWSQFVCESTHSVMGRPGNASYRAELPLHPGTVLL